MPELHRDGRDMLKKLSKDFVRMPLEVSRELKGTQQKLKTLKGNLKERKSFQGLPLPTVNPATNMQTLEAIKSLPNPFRIRNSWAPPFSVESLKNSRGIPTKSL